MPTHLNSLFLASLLAYWQPSASAGSVNSPWLVQLFLPYLVKATSFLAMLTNLFCAFKPFQEILYLFKNQLSGSLSGSIFASSKLQEIQIQQNAFSSRIPSEIGLLVSMSK